MPGLCGNDASTAWSFSESSGMQEILEYPYILTIRGFQHIIRSDRCGRHSAPVGRRFRRAAMYSSARAWMLWRRVGNARWREFEREHAFHAKDRKQTRGGEIPGQGAARASGSASAHGSAPCPGRAAPSTAPRHTWRFSAVSLGNDVLLCPARRHFWSHCTRRAMGTLGKSQASGSGSGNVQPHNSSLNKAPLMTIDKSKLYTATIKTTRGDIVIQLNAATAPNAVNNFV